MTCQVDRLQITRYLWSTAVLPKRQDPDLSRLPTVIGRELVGRGAAAPQKLHINVSDKNGSHKALVNVERSGLRCLLVVADETTREDRMAQHQGLKCVVIYTLQERLSPFCKLNHPHYSFVLSITFSGGPILLSWSQFFPSSIFFSSYSPSSSPSSHPLLILTAFSHF